MARRAAIIATGQTRHKARRRDVNIVELVNESVRACLEDADMAPADIDGVVIGNMEHFEGVYNADLWAVDGVGSLFKHSMKVTTGGTTGASVAHAGFYHVASGLFDTVLCIGKSSRTGTPRPGSFSSPTPCSNGATWPAPSEPLPWRPAST